MSSFGTPLLTVVAFCLFSSLLPGHLRADGRLADEIDALLSNLSPDTTVGIAIVGDGGDSLYERNGNLELSSASSIKTNLLGELFARYATELDVSPRPEIRNIVTDSNHPAIAHFSPADKEMVAKDLAAVSIKRLGKILIDSEDEDGKEYENVVYNAAANVAIALLGGPEGATRRMQARHPACRSVHMRRYMLADRNLTGDNTASPLALAHFFHLVLGNELSGISPDVTRSLASILRMEHLEEDDILFAKAGVLHTDPVTSVWAGQHRNDERSVSFALMATQTLRSPTSGAEQHESLDQLTQQIFTLIKAQ